MNRPTLIALLALGLSACQTPTFYQPAQRPGAVGYSEARIEPGRYRVTFQGGGGAPAAQVADYALLRAAEITLRDGYDWFRITDRFGQVAPPRSAGQVSIGGGGASFGGHGAVGLGLGTTFDLGGGPALSRSIEVLAGKGPAPHEPDVYDAHGVVSAIGPRAGR
ncbi:MAG: CC0125/CC1285 family lipoprotein [Caulobacteraceae bacterium]